MLTEDHADLIEAVALLCQRIMEAEVTQITGAGLGEPGPAEQGDHADYYSSALYLGRSAAEGVGCDNTTGPSRELTPAVALVPTDPAAAVRAYPWLGYLGHWGEEHRAFYDGPSGPNTQRKWAAPLTWAASSWRDRSFVVPAGKDVGSTATAFFCRSIAIGSNLLTAAVGDPTPVLVVLSLIVALLLWLVTRTEWGPSQPFAVRRTRPWGAIVASARRMYTGHLRLFLGIGALLLPLGVLITIVQALIFRVGSLASLVDVAGAGNAFVAIPALALGTFLTVLGLAVVQTLTAFAMGELDAGHRPTPLSAYRAARGALPAVLRSVVAIAVVVAVLGLTGIGGILAVWLLVRWSLVAQVVAFERLPARAALGRSARLVRGGWWRTASLVTFVGGVALLLGPLTGTALLFVSSASFDLVNLVSSVVYAFVLPFVAIATTYLYFDRRATVEGERTA
ncbi:MAG: hypothetical protein U0Y82_05460 [Thermoleophilia bacterium]